MARAAFGISSHDLAALAGVNRVTVARFEAGEDITTESRNKIKDALAAKGAQFTRRGGRIGTTVPEQEI
jgi:predicted transcriptional regulator